MGLLENYKQQHPEDFREPPQWEPPREYGFFIRMVMRMSGGRIRDMDRAAQVLLVFVVFVVFITIIVFLVLNGTSGTNLEDQFPSGFPVLR